MLAFAPCISVQTPGQLSLFAFSISLFAAVQNLLYVSLQAAEQGRPPEHTSKFYAKGALQYLVPILTQTLTKQVS